ncbi:MAG TPA: hypothetical protein VKP88_01305 [Candidatus Paceibacterota bacterium]|nr:hypothetical protein [Candidatus Paceibacterota bacterium]
MKRNLSATIMRQVYYAAAIHWATHPVTLYALGLLVLGWWLKELVFVAQIWDAFVSRPVGELGNFTLGVVQGADTLTLLVTALVLVCAVALYRQLRHLRAHSYTPLAL